MKVFIRNARAIAFCCLVCFLTSCTVGRTIQIPKDKPITVGERSVIIHAGQTVTNLINVEIFPDKLTGEIPDHPIVSDKKTELHIYLKSDFEIARGALKLAIPLESIEKIEKWEKDSAGSTIVTVLAVVGITYLTLGIVLLIVMLTKESCPFIYAFNGETYDFAGEIFSGAIYPPLERHDYLLLPSLEKVDGVCRVKITNEVREIQHTNMIELLALDHIEGAEVLIDKYGEIHTLSSPHPPASAYDLEGRSILEDIYEIGGACHASNIFAESDRLMDGVVLGFERPGEVDRVSLRIRAKNSYWLDYTYSKLYSRFGDAYAPWKESKKYESGSKLTAWSLSQGIPLSAYIKKGGEWEFADYFNIAGPVAFKDDVLSLDISDVETALVEIKLEFGYYFWEIDYVAMDYSPQPEVVMARLSPVSAVDPIRGDVTKLLAADDSLYYVQPDVGDEAVMLFDVPPCPEGMGRSYVLHSKGHYETIVDVHGEPDIPFLTRIKEPGGFIELAKELFRSNFSSLTGRDERQLR